MGYDSNLIALSEPYRERFFSPTVRWRMKVEEQWVSCQLWGDQRLECQREKDYKCQSEDPGLRCLRVSLKLTVLFKSNKWETVFMWELFQKHSWCCWFAAWAFSISLYCPTKAKHSNYTKTKIHTQNQNKPCDLCHVCFRTDHSLRDPIPIITPIIT